MMLSTNTPTEELQRIDAAHHTHPFSTNADFAKKGARVITRAEGCWLTDSEGNRILDGMAGLWCVNIGYGRTELAEVARKQMEELPYYNTFFQTTHIPAIALSQKLAELAPGDLNHVMYSCSGSEANDTNLRIVRTYWEAKGQPHRKAIISRWNAYHGSSVGSASLGGMKGMHMQGGLPIPDIHHIDQPNWYAEGGDMSPEEFGLERARQLEAKILELGPENIAAFIAEPVQGAGGVIIAPDTYWPEIQRIVDEYGILLIADEVICGFGRTGHWFGTEALQIKPHLMTMAKGLSSGYQPIGGSMLCDEVAEVMNQIEFNHGYTYSSHPVAAAVALENLRILESEQIIETVREDTGPYLKAKFESLTDHPLVGEAKIIGMMGSIALTPDKASRAPFKEPGTAGFICREHCFANNLVMRHVYDRMIISPPLVISKEEIDVLIARAIKALDETYAALKAQGLMS